MCWLAGFWILFSVRFLQLTLIWETDIVIFGTQNLAFGMPGDSTLAPWKTMGRSRDTWEHKKADVGVQAWIFIDFGRIAESLVPPSCVGKGSSCLLVGGDRSPASIRTPLATGLANVSYEALHFHARCGATTFQGCRSASIRTPSRDDEALLGGL